MLSVVIPVLQDEPALVDTLAALVPAAAEGVVRDLVLCAPEDSGFLREMADAAGCGVVTSLLPRQRLVAEAASRVKGPWVLVLEPGLVPGGDWMSEAADFLEDVDGNPGAAAVFTLAGRGSVSVRAAAAWRNAASSLFGRAHPLQGLVAHRDAIASGRRRITRLASPVYDRRGHRRHRDGRPGPQ